MELINLPVRALTSENFAPFGDIIETGLGEVKLINWDITERHHALATVQRGEGEAIISIFRSQAVSLPYDCPMLERHPLGSQAFMPLGPDAWMTVVAPDDGGKPGQPIAFLVPAGTGINLRAGVWHGVLTPLGNPAQFLVVDREGDGVNLEEAQITPVRITE